MSSDFDFQKWIAEVIHQQDAETYGISVEENAAHERYFIIDNAVWLIDRAHGGGYACKHPEYVKAFLAACIGLDERLSQIIRGQGGRLPKRRPDDDGDPPRPVEPVKRAS